MMRFHWPISNVTFFWSAENEDKQCSSVIFAYFIFQENWKIELAGPCTDPASLSFTSMRCSYNILVNKSGEEVIVFSARLRFISV